MTIPSDQSETTVAGTGASVTFDFPFVPYAASNLFVTYTDPTGVSTLLSSSVYTVSINAVLPGNLWAVGGTVTYPLTGSPIPIGSTLLIQRILPYQQLVDLTNQGNFYPTAVESGLDILEMQIQQIASRTGAQRGEWATGIFYSLNDIVQDGENGNNTGNYYTCAIENTSGVWSTDLAAGDWSLSFNLQQVEGYATAAAASAATSTTEAGVSTTQAGIATTEANAAHADRLLADADVVLTHADVVTTNNNVTTTNNNVITTTTQAGIATTQAGISTTQAGISTTEAGISTTQAGISTTAATSSAASAIQAASTFTSTSTTSNTIGTGSLTFTTQTNKGYAATQFIESAHDASNYVAGTVTSYNNSTGVLVMNATNTLGSGTYTSWNLSIIGAPGLNGTGSGTVTLVTFTGDGTVLSSTPSSAVTTAGTVTGTLNTQVANKVFAGPTTGSAANPTFRSLVAGDFPSATIPLASLAAQAADTFLANATAGSASPTAVALAASQLAGRGSTGDIAAIVLGTNLSMSGATLNATGGSELVLIATATASSSATLDFTTGITSAYSQFIFIFDNLFNATNSQQLNCVTSINGGSTWGSANYLYGLLSFKTPSTTGSSGSGSSSVIVLGNDSQINTVTNSGLSGVMNWYSLGEASNIHKCDFNVTYPVTGAVENVNGFGVDNNSASAINGIRFSYGSGNITSGHIYLYGVKNT